MTSVSSTSSTTSTTSTTSTSSTSFDTAALVEAKLVSRYERIDSLTAEVTANETKIAAYQDMQTLLQTVVDSLESLRSVPGTTGRADDVFRDRTAYLTSSSSTAASTYMAATIAEGVDLDTHTIKIEQVATTNIIASSSQTSKSTALGLSGVFSLGTEDGASADITVTATMTLAEIATAINAEKSTTGVTAAVMKVSDTSYVLTLTTADTGQTIVASDVSGGLLQGSLGVLDSSGDPASVLQAGNIAKFTVDGVAVERSSNDVDDVLDGITLHLYAAPSTDTTLTLEIDNDLTAVNTAITDFVTAYNAFRDFVISNQETTTDGTATDDATLFGDLTLRTISQNMQAILTSMVDTESLGAVGITFDINNKLVVNDTTLQNVLVDDFDAIQSLFSYSMTSSASDLQLLRHPDSSFNFTLDVTVVDGTLTAASIGGDSSLFTVSGSSITGVEGTIYEGLVLVYTGKTDKSITVELSQGIADQLSYAVDEVSRSDSTDGASIAVLISNLKTSDDKLNDRISTLTTATETYASSLYSLYSNVAAKLAVAETTIALLKALLDSDSNN